MYITKNVFKTSWTPCICCAANKHASAHPDCLCRNVRLMFKSSRTHRLISDWTHSDSEAAIHSLMSSLWERRSSHSRRPCSRPCTGRTPQAEARLRPGWSPAEGHRGPVRFVSARYASTTTTRDILSPRITSPGWRQHHTEREAVSLAVCREIWVDVSLSVSGAVHRVHCGDLTGERRKQEVCRYSGKWTTVVVNWS